MIELQQVAIRAGGFRLDEVSLQIPPRAYAVLMGKTGSGKTTLLEAVCGLKSVVGGKILLAGEDVTELGPAQRQIGFVPQDGALFDHCTVREHLEFALWVRGWATARIDQRIAELAKELLLEPLLDRYPQGLSGGERQRVALGRALSFHPRILCLDEPLSTLDDDTRGELIRLLKKVQKSAGLTALHVTHHRHEAEQLADVRLELQDGKISVVAAAR